jgi:Lar family restriction alleviation protein
MTKKKDAADDEMLARLDALDDLETGELLPCPFCGGEAERIDFEDEEVEPDNIGGSCISCTQCHVSTAVVFDFKETLYSSWNERVRTK